MGYSIEYAQDLNKAFKRRRPFRFHKKMIWTASGILVLFMVLLFSRVRSAVWEFFVPGDSAVTAAAFSDMIYDIRNGQTVTDAFYTFCKEIFVNG